MNKITVPVVAFLCLLISGCDVFLDMDVTCRDAIRSTLLHPLDATFMIKSSGGYKENTKYHGYTWATYHVSIKSNIGNTHKQAYDCRWDENGVLKAYYKVSWRS